MIKELQSLHLNTKAFMTINMAEDEGQSEVFDMQSYVSKQVHPNNKEYS
jgi:hypothetical protein